MDLENNGASLPSSDASIAEKVAPEPLESSPVVIPFEDANPHFEEPDFQVYFQNDNGQTEVTVEGVDQDMLLFDLTLAFNETSVRSAHTFELITPRCVCCVRNNAFCFETSIFIYGSRIADSRSKFIDAGLLSW